MRRFLYFFPGVPGVSREMLTSFGVLDRFGDRGNLIERQTMPIDAGPAGSGCLIAAGTQPPEFAPDRQQWMEGPKFWVGMETDDAPKPQDLAREVGISGYDTQLGDGNEWRVPLLRRWDMDRMAHVVNLPHALGPVMTNGKRTFASRVRPEFSAVDALGARLLESFVEERTVPMDELFADAAALLAVNYRVGIEECGLLGLFDEAGALRVAIRAIDGPALQAAAQAAAQEGLEYTPQIAEE